MYDYKDVTPRYNQIITTAKKFELDVIDPMTGLVDLRRTKGKYKWQQQVIKVGPNVRDLKPGDWVEISFDKRRYIEFTDAYLKRHGTLAGFDSEARASHLETEGVIYHYPEITIGGETCFLIYDDDVLYSFEP